MTCNHMCITFQHKTIILIPIVMTLSEQLNENLFSASQNISTLHHFPVISYVQENIQTCILPVEISLNSHIWFFSVCHSVTARRRCDLEILT